MNLYGELATGIVRQACSDYLQLMKRVIAYESKAEGANLERCRKSMWKVAEHELDYKKLVAKKRGEELTGYEPLVKEILKLYYEDSLEQIAELREFFIGDGFVKLSEHLCGKTILRKLDSLVDQWKNDEISDDRLVLSSNLKKRGREPGKGKRWQTKR